MVTNTCSKATDNFSLFFKEHPEAPGYFKFLEVGGNTKVKHVSLILAVILTE